MANTTALDEFDTEFWSQTSIHNIIARAMGRLDAATFKFDAEMVRSNDKLWDWAVYAVDHYQGTFEMMVDFRNKQRRGLQLNENQLKAALNTVLNCWRRSLKEIAAKVEAREAAQARQPGRPVMVTIEGGSELFDQPVDFQAINPQVQRELNPETLVPAVSEAVKAPHAGTYTFVDGSGEYRVLKFEEYQGQTYISYQNGPDNNLSFIKFGKIDTKSQLVIWNKGFGKGQTKVAISATQRASLEDAVHFICNFDKDAQLKAGEAYAIKSGQCFICGRTLTVPSSISAGIGPVCAKSWSLH